MAISDKIFRQVAPENKSIPLDSEDFQLVRIKASDEMASDSFYYNHRLSSPFSLKFVFVQLIGFSAQFKEFVTYEAMFSGVYDPEKEEYNWSVSDQQSNIAFGTISIAANPKSQWSNFNNFKLYDSPEDLMEKFPQLISFLV